MTGHSAAGLARWSGAIGGRVARAWGRLPPERRLAAGASVGLFVTLFLPWYQETVIVPGVKAPATASTSLTGWGAFSFVEAAVLMVAVGVLTLLLQRAEGRPFHLPGGDGLVILAAGGWTCVLVIWRIFDKQTTSIHGPGATISGIDWGIFTALGVAMLLTLAGSRIRAAHQPEPPLPGEDGARRAGDPRTDRVMGDVEAPERPRTGTPRPDSPQDEFRPPGWLSARPKHLDAETGRPLPDDQLTIPLEHEE